MNILHINTSDQGGAATAVIRLHMALLEQGLNSKILFLKKMNQSIPYSYSYNNNKLQFKNSIHKKIIKLNNAILFKNKRTKNNNSKLKNKIEGYDLFSFNQTDFDITTQQVFHESDVIHLHWVAGFFDFKSFKKIRKPIIWTLHDMNPFTGGCHYARGCEKFKNECKKCPQLLGTINDDNSFLDQEYKNRFLSLIKPVITAPSLWMQNCSAQSTLFKNFTCIHIPYSLDTSIFRPLDKDFCRNALNIPKEKKILLFISEYIDDARKGFNKLVNAISMLNTSKVQLCAIGEINDRKKYTFDISYYGRIFDERLLVLFYSAADVLLLPSDADNLPNVMIESLACGTPVIGFPVGGIPDAIISGFNGVLAEDLSIESLSKAISDYLTNEYYFDSIEISNNARNKYSPQIQALKYLELYKKEILTHQHA